MPGIFICTKKKRPDLILPKAALTNANICRKCGKPYEWKVQSMHQKERPTTEREDNRTRAAALWMEYRQKGIGPCCAHPEHRNFIARYAGLVVYN